MKYFFTMMLLMIASFASAQIVNLPDPLFKQYLVEYNSPVIDTNGDGEIQESEALAITNLYLVGDWGFTNITGIKSFTNLDTLNTVDMDLTSIDLSGMTSLRAAYISGMHISNIDISNCINLRDFSSEDGGNWAGDSIVNVNITGDHYLHRLYFGKLNLPSLDLSECDSLAEFTMETGDIHGMLNVSGLTKLTKLNFVGHVGSINATNDINLKTIIGATTWVDGFSTEEMLLTNCSSIEQLQVIEFHGGSLDLSSCPHLWALNMNCDNLHYLNIKDGNIFPGAGALLAQNFSVYNTNPGPGNLYVCTDDAETAKIESTLLNDSNWPFATTVVNSFCSPSSIGGNYNTISGNIRWDRDHNGCDNADSLMPYIPVKITDALGNYVVRYSDNPGGLYKYYDTIGNFTVQPYFPYPYYSISPASANVAFNTISNIITTTDFCIASNGNHNQLDITIVPDRQPAPGSPVVYRIYYRNRGTTTLSGNIQFNFDDNKMGYSSSWPAGFQSGGALTWNYANLQPFETKWIQVILDVLPPPTNNAGDTLMLLATISPVAGDEIPSNNNFVLPQLVVNSNDPNDKLCLQGGKLDITKIAEKLDYVIHFQNLGTGPASHVVITDTLSNNLDWDSFELTSTSHPCEVQRKDDKLQFYFKDINLPYASSDEPGSHGFVAFKIKPKGTVAIGDSINNRASIYFDFNAAVVTNMATTIVSPTSPVAVKLEYFSLTTKNETNLLTWKSPATSGTTHFGIERSNDGIHFSNFGNITASVDRCQLPFNFTDEKPFDGKTYYRLNIKDADGISFYSKILVAAKTRSGLSINAVVSDRNNTTIYLNASKAQNLQMKIIAADGRLVYNQSKTIEAGSTTLNLPLKNLATGIYTLIVYTGEGEVITKRFVK